VDEAAAVVDDRYVPVRGPAVRDRARPGGVETSHVRAVHAEHHVPAFQGDAEDVGNAVVRPVAVRVRVRAEDQARPAVDSDALLDAGVGDGLDADAGDRSRPDAGQLQGGVAVVDQGVAGAGGGGAADDVDGRRRRGGDQEGVGPAQAAGRHLFYIIEVGN